MQYDVFNLAGVKFHMAESPPQFMEAVSRAFSLSLQKSDTFDVEVVGHFVYDEAYVTEMPEFVQEHYINFLPDEDPVTFAGPDGEIAILAKGEDNSAYTICPAPYSRFHLVAQRLSAKPTPFIFQTVMIPMISELLLRREKLLMHAACVVSPRGQGLLFLGDSGDGKTTTAFTMARQGFGFLSDDMVIACKTGDDIELVAVREKLNFTAKTIGFFPELSKTVSKKIPAGTTKAPVDPQLVMPNGSLLDTAAPKAIFILHKHKDGPRLEPAGAKPMIEAMLKAATFARSESVSAQRVALIWALLDQTQSFDLITGLNPQALGRFLSQSAKNNFHAQTPTEPAIHVKKKDLTIENRRLNALKSILAHTLDGAAMNKNQAMETWKTATHPSFNQWARFHRIHPLVTKWMAGQDQPNNSNLIEKAKQEMMHDTAQSLDMLFWTRTIIQALETAGISAVVMRGPTMATQFFPVPQLRHYRDLDFFIQEKELETAEGVLQDLGFELHGERNYWLMKKELRYSNGRVDVELHWEFFLELKSRRNGVKVDFDLAIKEVMLDGQPVKMLSTTQLMLSSCLHFALEHKSDRIVRLVDLRQLILKGHDALDWQFIVNQAHATNTRMAVGHSLYLSKVLVDAQVPEDVLKSLQAKTLVEKIAALSLNPKLFLLPQAGPKTTLRRFFYHKIISPKNPNATNA